MFFRLKFYLTNTALIVYLLISSQLRCSENVSIIL